MAASESSIKFAIAVAILRSKLLVSKQQTSVTTTSLSQLKHKKWKKKAKDRKQEILRFKQQLKELEDGFENDLFPPNASCKCYFFDNLGKFVTTSNSDNQEDESDRRVNQVLHRRFLRQVRLKERRKRSDESVKQRYVSELNVDYEIEQLSISVDYLVDLCRTFNPVETHTSFLNLSHQAVDFILVTLKKLAREKNRGCIEGIVNGLITRLVGRMCTSLQRDESSSSHSDAQFCVQHLLRKLGVESYIGQRIMLAASQRILVLADSLLFMDPFDDAFPNAHSCIFLLIQLVEFLIADYTQSWASNEGMEMIIFEEWLRSILQARNALNLLESRNGLYVLYMDRITGQLAKQMGQVSCFQTLNPDILETLFY
ncbi:hypothetical protein IFM89_035291 [Coptis chinensis]|uniref:Multipolar spindle 1 n=1 Tax=Coptis chinensis TaxID=261450 RepID=A0A835IG36_9MAGN|nr:hypothetical protein IFM89_035291 [Coptis chinensis]